MGYQCKICGINSLFIIWSTSREFPRDELGHLLDIDPKHLDAPVCMHCCKKFLNYPEDLDEEIQNRNTK